MSDKKSILVAEDDEIIRDIIVMMIESEFDNEVIEANNAKVAIEKFGQGESFCLVVSDFNMPGGDGDELYAHVKSTLDVPFILCSAQQLTNLRGFDNFEADGKYHKYIMKPFEQGDLLDLIEAGLKIVSSDLQATKVQDDNKYRVRINRAKNFKNNISDIYVLVGDSKFLKVGNKGEESNQEQYQKFIDKGTEFIYFDKEQFNQYMTESFDHLKLQLQNTQVGSSELVTLQLDSIEKVQEVAKSIGIKEQVIELTDSLTTSVTSNLKSDKGLKSFIGQILKKENYFFELTNLISYLGGAVVKEMGLDEERTTSKLINAAMFCDIAIDDPKLGIIVDLNSPDFEKLTAAEKKIVKEHTDKAKEKLGQAKNLTGEEDLIVCGHHEKPDGSGFPKGLTASQIKPLQAIFILCHDFAREMILTGDPDNIDPGKIIETLGPSYGEGNFKKPLEGLKKALKL